jgi:hypothetical protein
LFLADARGKALAALRRAEAAGDQEKVQEALLTIKDIDTRRAALA